MITPCLSYKQKIQTITFPAEETMLHCFGGISQGDSIAFLAFWPQNQSNGHISSLVTPRGIIFSVSSS